MSRCDHCGTSAGYDGADECKRCGAPREDPTPPPRKTEMNVIVHGDLADPDVLFERMKKTLNKMTAGVEKTALAMQLFGRAGIQLLDAKGRRKR